ncbi:MAG: ABC transporter permease [Clostridia bacterium]
MLIDMWNMLIERQDFFLELLLQHLRLSFTAIILSCLIGLLIGIFMSENEKLSGPIMTIINIVYTIPSISLLGFLLPFTGIGDKTASIALVLYGIMPVARNTYIGIQGVPSALLDAGKGMGSTRLQLLIKIKLPLAIDVILGGIRSMAVMTVAMTGIASFIGAGGLGVAIYRGINSNNMAMTYIGSILNASLALLVDWAIGRIQKQIKRNRREI